MSREKFADGKLTLHGAAVRAGLPYFVIQYGMETGRLPFERREGRRVAIHPKDLDAFLARR